MWQYGWLCLHQASSRTWRFIKAKYSWGIAVMILSGAFHIISLLPASFHELIDKFDMSIVWAFSAIIAIVIIVFIWNLSLTPYRIYKEQQSLIDELREKVRQQETEGKRIEENIARLARALNTIRIALQRGKREAALEVGSRGQSYFGQWETDKKEGIKEAKTAARDIYQLMLDGASLPDEIDREKLVDACFAVRHDKFDDKEVYKFLDRAMMVFAHRERSQRGESS